MGIEDLRASLERAGSAPSNKEIFFGKNTFSRTRYLAALDFTCIYPRTFWGADNEKIIRPPPPGDKISFSGKILFHLNIILVVDGVNACVGRAVTAPYNKEILFGENTFSRTLDMAALDFTFL